jgi:2-C-methyl-D-erythritol 4-phosphate cytidylyltransferase
MHKQTIHNIIIQSKKKKYVPKNIGLLLAAGTSSRFGLDVPKQLYRLNGNNPIIWYSLDLLVHNCDQIVIVTNSQCVGEIKHIVSGCYLSKNQVDDVKKIHIVCNDINCRLESIEKGLGFISENYQKNTWDNIIIHDSARPYVPKQYICNMLEKTDLYSQYCLKLNNGLMDLKNLNVLDRDNYVELCTPILSNFNLYMEIFMNFISKKNRFVHEPIDILKEYKINVGIIYGHQKFLKKITHFDDIDS